MVRLETEADLRLFGLFVHERLAVLSAAVRTRKITVSIIGAISNRMIQHASLDWVLW
jgi:hypothetical protein